MKNYNEFLSLLLAGSSNNSSHEKFIFCQMPGYFLSKTSINWLFSAILLFNWNLDHVPLYSTLWIHCVFQLIGTLTGHLQA